MRETRMKVRITDGKTSIEKPIYADDQIYRDRTGNLRNTELYAKFNNGDYYKVSDILKLFKAKVVFN